VTAAAHAYSTGAQAWADGPARVYERMADALVARSPVSLRDRLVVDLGAGTGAASVAALAEGARVIAVDGALGMLRNERANRPPCTVGDASALPLRSGSVDAVVAAFVLNHLDDPSVAVGEIDRVLVRDGHLLASTYANDDHHPVREAVEQALHEHGWSPPAWYGAVRAAMHSWGTTALAEAAIVRGGMQPVDVAEVAVAMPDLSPDAVVASRMGMAQCAPFVASLDATVQHAVHVRARALLGPHPPPLVRRVIFIVARAR